MSFGRALVTGAAGLLLLVSLSCNNETDDDGSGGRSSGCGTLDNPEILQLADVQPTAGSSVENAAIVHAFTVVGAPGRFETLTFTLHMMQHTAGQPSPASFSFTITPQGGDDRYEAQPVSWSDAPGNVNLAINDLYQATDGCVYAFPAPLFQYEITPAGPGTGGEGPGGGGPAGGGAPGGGYPAGGGAPGGSSPAGGGGSGGAGVPSGGSGPGSGGSGG